MGEASSDSDSDSDADEDDYETVYLECEAGTQRHLGHVVSDVSISTAAHAGSSTKTTCGYSVDKPETEMAKSDRGSATNRVTVIGLNGFEPNTKDRVIVVWKAYNPEQENAEPEVHEETDHTTECASLTLPCCEEVLSVCLMLL